MLEFYKKKVDETLAKLIPEDSTFFTSLYAGSRYALLAPGKRIRPLLTLCTAEIFKKNAAEQALIPACALEMVHTYSLVHDDLPCMDDDDFRRGLPTLHRVYTEGHAVLMGDYLLTYAFEILSSAPYLQPGEKVTLLQKLARAAGGEGMIGGQIMDIENSEAVEEMHARKTAALFTVAVEFGGIISQCAPEMMLLLHKFGIQFGKLFQIIDDLLDGDHPFGQKQAEEAAFSLYHAAIKTLSLLPGDTASLKKLTEQVFSSKPAGHAV
jgi:geranylgeranyl diphosphate synthase type II